MDDIKRNLNIESEEPQEENQIETLDIERVSKTNINTITMAQIGLNEIPIP